MGLGGAGLLFKLKENKTKIMKIFNTRVFFLKTDKHTHKGKRFYPRIEIHLFEQMLKIQALGNSATRVLSDSDLHDNNILINIFS